VTDPARPPQVLFVCVHNAGRSQMAAALLAHHAGDRVVVRSAGSTPADEVNPAVVASMAEIGLDVSKEFPKPLTTEGVEASDVVITMGCGDACPIFPGKHYLDWDLPDPSGLSAEDVRPIREEIDRKVRELVEELLSDHGGLSHGQISYLQIPATDLMASASFYEAIFGWRIERPHPSFEAPGVIGQWVDDRPVARDAGLLAWIQVDRIDETLDLVRANGGEVVEPPFEDGPARWLATIRDPAGNLLGIVSHGSR
jgi:arsenate reductase